jgi:hypothetical protein
MNIGTNTYMIISIPKECHEVLNRIATARSLRSRDQMVTAEIIAREAVIEFVDEVERMEAGLKPSDEQGVTD